MTRSIYITSIEGHAGKSTVALGMLDTLSHETERVGVFRPVARSGEERDYVLEMLLAHDGVDLDYEECVGVSYDDVVTSLKVTTEGMNFVNPANFSIGEHLKLRGLTPEGPLEVRAYCNLGLGAGQ